MVVTDDRDGERIVADVVEGIAEPSVELPRCRPGRRSAVVGFASPGDEELVLPAGLGRQLWVDGDAVDEFGTWFSGLPE